MNKDELIACINKMLEMISKVNSRAGLCAFADSLGEMVQYKKCIVTELKEKMLHEYERRYGSPHDPYWWHDPDPSQTKEEWYRPRIEFLKNWLDYLNESKDEE